VLAAVVVLVVWSQERNRRAPVALKA
jgi:hypothetical protein